MAENSAGRSEVTFKVWFNPAEDHRGSSDDRSTTGAVHDGGNEVEAGTTSEVLVGSLLGTATVAVAGLALCLFCVLRRRQPCGRKYAYYVRDSRHSNGTTKPPASTHAPTGYIRRLVVRGRRCFRIASVAEDAGESGVACRCDDDDNDDDDKFVSSTLQSLLEAKRLFGESLPRATTADVDEAEKKRPDYDVPLQRTEEQEADDQMKEEVDVDRCPCSCADNEVAVDDSASKTDSVQDAVEDPAPDLLSDADGHTFRRGGVARSPYRRAKPKVSFAVCRSPSSDLTSGGGDLTSSQQSSTPRWQVAASSDDDGANRVGSSILRGVSRHSCCVVDVSDSPPSCSSKDEIPRTADMHGSVRRSCSSNAVGASRLPPPPPPMPLYSSLSRTVPQRLRQRASAAGRHNDVDVDRIEIALPATIYGVTEGLFPPPTKPARTHEWRAGGGEGSHRLGPRLSDLNIRRTPRNCPPCAVSQGTEV